MLMHMRATQVAQSKATYMFPIQQRGMSMKQDKGDEDEKYSQQFEKLVGKASKKLTKQEEEQIEKAAADKRMKDEEAAAQDAINQKLYDEKKQ